MSGVYRGDPSQRVGHPAGYFVSAVDELNRLAARIAQLETLQGKAFALAPGAHETPGECSTWYDGCHCTNETLAHNIKRADEAEAALNSPAHRARIAREFFEELQREPEGNDWQATRDVLARWEAAAKEGA